MGNNKLVMKYILITLLSFTFATQITTKQVTISIDSKGNYFLELDTFKNISMDLMKLESELIKIIPKNKIEIFIRADSQVIFNDVALLMSSLQKLKPNSINFLTEPKDD